MMVNDSQLEKHGTLQLKFVGQDVGAATFTQTSFQLNALGAESYLLTIHTPEQAGKYTLEAVATASDDASDPTLSRRWVTVVSPTTKH
jgi:hypothetical protein